MHGKLGLPDRPGTDELLVEDLLEIMRELEVDWTTCFRALARSARGDDAGTHELFAAAPERLGAWLTRWTALGPDPDAMDLVNPVYVPRNHLVEDALTYATVGDLGPYRRLVEVVSRPFEERPGLDAYAQPAAPDAGAYVTYCGT
jgi:uncharacterized protein YdiU (UPF0061 family)